MSTISLREYNREISDLIDRGLNKEAQDHCKYILGYYPKNIDTYRLLGKSYLESSDYKEAGDIFQRILGVLPSDYVTHIGMSICQEEDQDLTGALWHMERAFELQPSNPVIHDELKVLYGKRDGEKPEKIRLTRGALALMYARGNQLRQAVAEINAILRETQDRPDLLVALAELYVKLNMLEEFLVLANRLLEKSPYCQPVLKLLVDVAAPISQDERNRYRTRLIELDPYENFIPDQYPDLASVPDTMILLERFSAPAETEKENLETVSSPVTQKSESGELLSLDDVNILPEGKIDDAVPLIIPVGIHEENTDSDLISDENQANPEDASTSIDQQPSSSTGDNQPLPVDQPDDSLIDSDTRSDSFEPAVVPIPEIESTTDQPAAAEIPGTLTSQENDTYLPVNDLTDWSISREPVIPENDKAIQQPENAEELNADTPDWLKSIFTNNNAAAPEEITTPPFSEQEVKPEPVAGIVPPFDETALRDAGLHQADTGAGIGEQLIISPGQSSGSDISDGFLPDWIADLAEEDTRPIVVSGDSGKQLDEPVFLGLDGDDAGHEHHPILPFMGEVSASPGTENSLFEPEVPNGNDLPDNKFDQFEMPEWLREISDTDALPADAADYPQNLTLSEDIPPTITTLVPDFQPDQQADPLSIPGEISGAEDTAVPPDPNLEPVIAEIPPLPPGAESLSGHSQEIENIPNGIDDTGNEITALNLDEFDNSDPHLPGNPPIEETLPDWLREISEESTNDTDLEAPSIFPFSIDNENNTGEMQEEIPPFVNEANVEKPDFTSPEEITDRWVDTPATADIELPGTIAEPEDQEDAGAMHSSIEQIKQSLEENAEDPDLWQQLGDALRETGDIFGAVSAYNKATEITGKKQGDE